MQVSLVFSSTSNLYDHLGSLKYPKMAEESKHIHQFHQRPRFDDNKIVDLAIGEKNVFKRRGQREDHSFLARGFGHVWAGGWKPETHGIFDRQLR